VLNVMALTKPSIIINLHGIVKLMKRLTLLSLKPSRANLVLILSNVQTTRANIKWTPLTVISGNTGLTENGILKNTLKFKKIKNNQFIHL